jgi:hypothetical protein
MLVIKGETKSDDIIFIFGDDGYRIWLSKIKNQNMEYLKDLTYGVNPKMILK